MFFCVVSRTIGTHYIMKSVGVFTDHLLFLIKMKLERSDGLDWEVIYEDKLTVTAVSLMVNQRGGRTVAGCIFWILM
jgi:hypothetical protein